MKKIFADSYFFLALMNKRDASHQRAANLIATLPGPIVTTQWVLVEVADAFSQPKDRDLFAKLLQLMEADERLQIISASKASFERGTDLFTRRKDKFWSLTDCISFLVMDQHKIKEALTGDRHFEQAGFVPLQADSAKS